ncbi:Methionine--tRNA ligase [Bdellovibrio bacteriovorus]|uniref:methionine--tRNA ligase n=1 Tax=Bdellovibrio bacteriovorus TaxID=959 RepID=UPI00045BF463|nr:methionine--tRNA ligase [Bdellovibrio bacteriovorus]AHZ84256.1 methionine--tRNA ligase [Bdellovibrio bacteriovorus]BEV68142.1 Methionine--tRNA ligase [Bdellovibrio bacteriovorus]
MNDKRKILITCALPYANGYIHLGHLVEYLQADFWARFQNMRGNECVFICADDTHGTPIMVKARELGITPEALIAQSYKEHTQDFADFQVQFSHFGSTNSEENRLLCEYFYKKMQEGNHTRSQPIQQMYCNHDKMFLPDRFVKGTCPKCGAKEQYGDSCDVCASTYSPSDMKDVHCSLCGTAPVMKDSESIFFKLNDFKQYLEEWIPKHCSPEISKKMLEWFNEDLKDLDISRDEPYFGFAIPGTNNKKFFYVWVDAPMGYMSTTEQWAKSQGKTLKDIWQDPSREIYHFIGKDIARFHTIFWPAFLKAAEFRSPNQVFVHGHLMVNGEKMSKSKGTFIAARTYLNHLNPEYLRYYYSTKLSSSVDDIDLNLEDFTNRVNSELVGKITNLGSRGGQMLKKKMDGKMSVPDAEGKKLIEHAQKTAESIAAHYEARDFAKALGEIRGLADDANKYFDEKAPWKTLETDPEGTKQVITTTLNMFRMLAIYLKPVLPFYSQKVAKLLGEKDYVWSDLNTVLTNREINDYEHLATRIEADKVKAMVEEGRKINEEIQAAKKAASTAKPAAAPAPAAAATAGDRPAEIEFADFDKVDLRIGQVIEAEEIKEADKLLRLKIDIGEGQIRQIISGIKAAYKPEQLVGRKVLVCVNLKPRKMKFGMSEGMVLAAGTGGSDLFVLSADDGAQVGQRVK